MKEEIKIKEITPEIAKELAKESEELRREFNKRLKKMRDIPPKDWHILTK